MNYVVWLDRVGLGDLALVGGKNASLGHMIRTCTHIGIHVPPGFAVTTHAYRHFVEAHGIADDLDAIVESLRTHNDTASISKAATKARELINNAAIADDLAGAICDAYKKLCQLCGRTNLDVAVRSSATAEDAPGVSFAGQHESFLNIVGTEKLLDACKACFASLFTDRAIAYRVQKGILDANMAIAVGVQKMVRADVGCSGVAFSLDPESGFDGIVTINASYGLGESVVKGLVTPDEFVVHKNTLMDGFAPLVKKVCGSKETKTVYDVERGMTREVPVSTGEQRMFSLLDIEVLELAKKVILLERNYSAHAGHKVPLDVEWAMDGIEGLMYIVQARPETVHAVAVRSTATKFVTYTLDSSAEQETSFVTLATGTSVGQKIVHGTARVVKRVEDIGCVGVGDIIVTSMTDPAWVPAMKRAVGIVTDCGGRTCHAAIVARELGIPVIVGTGTATKKISDGRIVTVDCSHGDVGYVYDGAVPFKQTTVTFDTTPAVPVDVMVNISDPEGAFKTALLPVTGVGLLRSEFIISKMITVHPMAFVKPDAIKDRQTRERIDALTVGFDDKKQFFITHLAQAVGMVAAGFHPRPVIVRLSDFKSNEYRSLLGGMYYEPYEQNPMLGVRGAFRYYHDLYKEAFAMECAAIKNVREVMGFKNVKVMVPFVRTLTEATTVVDLLAHNGLKRGVDGLELILTCEIPSNVLVIDELCQHFDGFSLGSNDLTQLTLGVDRDSEFFSSGFDERDEAVVRIIKMAIAGAHRNNRPIGICGQAPSDYPEFAKLLIDLGIDSLSLNDDSVLPFFARYA